jgi:hypothetical protein
LQFTGVFMQRFPASNVARYIAKFRNGIWQVFDQVWYGVVGAEQTQKAADIRAVNLNARKGTTVKRVMR